MLWSVFRLEAYDRNHNFGKNDELEPEYHMTLPDPHLYNVNADTMYKVLFFSH